MPEIGMSGLNTVRRSKKTKAIAQSMITPKSMTPSKSKSAALGAVAVVFALAALAARTGAQDAGRAPRPEVADDKRWQTVAPGQVEPSSGAIKIAAPVMDVIAQVLVKVNDKVFAGEPLIRLTDNEARARLAAAEAQVAFRLRARNDETAPPRRTARRRAKDAVADADKAAARRRAEDAVANADNAVVEAQAALDRRVHHASRRRCCRVAARGAGAAADDATPTKNLRLVRCIPQTGVEFFGQS